MADDKLPDSGESDETTPTDPTTSSLNDIPAELTSGAEIDDPRDTPDDDYVDDPSTPDVNEAKLDRATDEIQHDRDAEAVTPGRRGRSRRTQPVRRTTWRSAAEDGGEEASGEDREPVAAEPARIGAGRVRKTAPVRRERTASTDADDKRTTPARFVAQSIGELRKVVWPTGSQVQQYFVVVLIFVLFIMTIVSLLDLGFGWVILKIFG